MDLTNAKVVVFRYTTQSRWYITERSTPGGYFYFDDTRESYITEEYFLKHDIFQNIVVIEEFTTPTLEELVRDAPAFIATDRDGISWVFSMSRGFSNDVNEYVPSRITPIQDVLIPLRFGGNARYRPNEIAEHIDIASVVRLVREQEC